LELVTDLRQKISEAFHSYSVGVVQRELATLETRAKEDIFGGVEGDDAFSDAMNEYLKYSSIVIDQLTMNWPDTDKKVELLHLCITRGYVLRESDESILVSEASRKYFSALFKKA
jgi:hypothetical protein